MGEEREGGESTRQAARASPSQAHSGGVQEGAIGGSGANFDGMGLPPPAFLILFSLLFLFYFFHFWGLAVTPPHGQKKFNLLTES